MVFVISLMGLATAWLAYIKLCSRSFAVKPLLFERFVILALRQALPLVVA
jgi:hypothetical protein